MPSGRLICRRSDENSAKYCSAGITLKNLYPSQKKAGESEQWNEWKSNSKRNGINNTGPWKGHQLLWPFSFHRCSFSGLVCVRVLNRKPLFASHSKCAHCHTKIISNQWIFDAIAHFACNILHTFRRSIDHGSRFTHNEHHYKPERQKKSRFLAYLWCSGRSARSDLNVSVTYLWKYVGKGRVVSKSNIRHRVGVGLCMKNTW